MHKKCDLGDFDHDMDAGVRWSGLSVSETAELSGVNTEWCDKQKTSREQQVKTAVRGEWLD